MRVVSEFHRGGLKVAIDHGGGLITSSAHLARALVREGQAVERRGDRIDGGPRAKASLSYFAMIERKLLPPRR